MKIVELEIQKALRENYLAKAVFGGLLVTFFCQALVFAASGFTGLLVEFLGGPNWEIVTLWTSPAYEVLLLVVVGRKVWKPAWDKVKGGGTRKKGERPAWTLANEKCVALALVFTGPLAYGYARLIGVNWKDDLVFQIFTTVILSGAAVYFLSFLLARLLLSRKFSLDAFLGLAIASVALKKLFELF